jgi:hypothetical protein
MTSKTGQRSNDFPWLRWWLTTYTLVLAANADRLSDSIWIFVPRSINLLTATAWNPFLANWLASAGASQIPLFIVGLALSGSLTVVGCFAARQMPVELAGVWFILVAVCFPIDHTLVMVFTVAAAWMSVSCVRRSAAIQLCGAFGMMILAASLFTQIAWPAAVFSGAFFSQLCNREHGTQISRALSTICVWCAGVVAGCVWLPGFFFAILQPWLAMTNPQFRAVMPSVSLVPIRAVHWILFVSFVILLATLLWRHSSCPRGRIARCTVLTVFAALGLGGWNSLLLSGCMMAIFPSWTVMVSSPGSRRLPFVGIAAAIVLMGIQWQRFGADLLFVRIEDRRINPHQWQVSGRVLLTNLDQSSDWHSSSDSPMFSLVLGERACSREVVQRYLEVCTDWKASRRERFLRADGSWGGYFTAFQEWEPNLIATDAGDVETVRNLSLDPNWKVIGIDSRRVIFGSMDDARLTPQIQNASQSLLHLEFPGRRRPAELSRTLMRGNRADAREVAIALTAMRLPYAALRILPDDDHVRTLEARTWCYVELAHRCRSHSGQVSLLDQYRAMKGLRQLRAASSMSGETQERVERAITALDLDDDGSTHLQPRPDNSSDFAVSEAEAELRQSLAMGDVDAINGLVQVVNSSPERLFFEAIVKMGDDDTESAIRLLDRAVESGELSAGFQHEAHFYLGCLAIENGDSQKAITQLELAVKSQSSGMFSPLAEFFLFQLSTER